MSDFLWDELEDVFVDLKEVEIDGRNAILPRKNGSDHVVRNESELDEVIPQPTSVFALIVERFAEVLGTNEILPNENFA